MVAAATETSQFYKPYLPHLDGIRAIAVIAILLFDFEVPGFRAGFVGVDIFLSLFGYLLTRNIVHNVHNSCFYLVSFYIRHLLRLYSSDSCAVLFAGLFAFLVIPVDLVLRNAYSGLASILFCSNVYFNIRHNYWDKTSSLKPLLYMWSVSLEEQFLRAMGSLPPPPLEDVQSEKAPTHILQVRSAFLHVSLSRRAAPSFHCVL